MATNQQLLPLTAARYVSWRRATHLDAVPPCVMCRSRSGIHTRDVDVHCIGAPPTCCYSCPERTPAAWVLLFPCFCSLCIFYYFAFGRSAKYCDERICMSVCLCVSSRLPKVTHPNFTKFSVRAVARSSSYDSGIHYVLPVLWMASCFLIMGLMACGISNIYVSAVLERVVKISNVLARCRHNVWLCRRIQRQEIAHRGR